MTAPKRRSAKTWLAGATDFSQRQPQKMAGLTAHVSGPPQVPLFPLGRLGNPLLARVLIGRVLSSTALMGTVLMGTSGCATGSGSRGDDDELPNYEEVDAGPSETHLMALENQPTKDPVEGVPAELRCTTDPGTVVARRLNRLEYNNTVRDLLDVTWNPADAFPKDDFGDSFDNNARALSTNPLLAAAYMDAAAAIAEEAGVRGSPVQRKVEVCSTTVIGVDACARITATELLKRAFRRPVLDTEVDRYVELIQSVRDEGGTFWEGVQAMLEATLLSVNFLYRVEVDPNTAEPHAVTDYELASRLSYFLWSSMPDDELFERAAAGDLGSENTLEKQVGRMLNDSKASALLDAFAGRWLEVDSIAESNKPSRDVFPEYTNAIERAMEQETRRFMRDIIFGDLPYDEALTANYTYLNEDLAAYYGIEGDFDSSFQRSALDGTGRVGLLTQGSILTLTGAPDRTSPTRRGTFVLSNLLCSAPPPPPGNVQGNLDTPPEVDAGVAPTIEERAREHASDPTCRACHAIMDPIGFGLENFDAVGRFREEENGVPIEASGDLLTSGGLVPFSGAQELSELLQEDPRLYACAVEKLFSFATGRLPSDSEADDACRTEKLTDAFADGDYDFRELITMVVLTDSFRGRRKALEAEETSP